MKRVVLVMALALMASSMAFAGSFTYYTTGTFNGAGGSTQYTDDTFATTTVADGSIRTWSHQTYSSGADSVEIQFEGRKSTSSTTPTQVSGGNFTLNVTGAGANLASCTTNCPANFTLNIFQTVPTGGAPNPGVVTADLVGTIGTTNTGEWMFMTSSPTVSIYTAGGIVTNYSVITSNTATNNPNCPTNMYCVALTDGGSIGLNVTQVPEPGSMLLLGTGLSGLAGIIRRRMKKA